MNSREAFIAWSGSEPVELELNQSAEDRDTFFAWQAWETAWQASRKQLLKELSEKEPVGYCHGDNLDRLCGGLAEFSIQMTLTSQRTGYYGTPLIIRPTEEA